MNPETEFALCKRQNSIDNFLMCVIGFSHACTRRYLQFTIMLYIEGTVQTFSPKRFIFCLRTLSKFVLQQIMTG